jgi:branched-chain amino acid transport system ATP-binding protein
MASIVEARGLNKQFGAVVAAKDISIAIDEGTITGLIGTNGAGKTTFVNMLTGYLKPDSGRISFRGEDITPLPPRAITRLGIARSFQIPQLFNSLTVRENLVLALAARGAMGLDQLRGVDFAALDAQASDIMERFTLSDFRDSAASTLPEGIRKLLDMAAAMVASPTVLLLDEPTSGVASEEKFSVMDRVMGATRGAGVTMLFVEHDMEIVRRYASRVIAFFAGTVLADGAPDVVLKDARVRELIIGDSQAPSSAKAGGVDA